jgi:general secretion pathway protein G
MKKKRNQPLGFTLIEVLIVLTILAIFILAALWAYRVQLMKGRDARRKSDLAKIQRVLEDYLNDHVCYPDALSCRADFSPYLSQIPCDPINSENHIYSYLVSTDEACKKWYKIFALLEYSKDPIIEKIGCTQEICGPFNYVVSSPNIEDLGLPLEEIFPPVSPTPGGGGTVTPSTLPTTTSGPSPTSGLTPTGVSTPTPTPTRSLPPCPGGWFTCLGQGGTCNFAGTYVEGAVCSSTCNSCSSRGCDAYPSCLH